MPRAATTVGVQWELTGQYHDRWTRPLPAPVHETTLPAQVEIARLRLDEYQAVVAAASSDGYNGVRIVGRAPSAGVDPEAVLVAAHDFWGRMATGKRMPFQMRVGTVPGNTVWMLASVTQHTGLTDRDRTGLRTYDAGLKVAQYAGDDEIIFAFV